MVKNGKFDKRRVDNQSEVFLKVKEHWIHRIREGLELAKMKKGLSIMTEGKK